MEILFLILKIIGICFLVLIGIFLFLILSILFIPVRYRIKGKGEVPKTLETDAVFSWFLHVIHGRIHYNTNGLQFNIRIFGIPLHLGKEKKSKKRIRKKRKKKTKESEVQKTVEENNDAEQENKIQEISEENSTVEQENSIVVKEDALKQTEKKDAWWRKLSFSKIKERCKNVLEKLKNIKEQLTNIKSIISAETNRNAVSALFQELKYLLKHYTPRKASGELLFGTEDPANTGELLGVISMMPFWYRYQISVIPDFTAEAFYAKGNIYLKGYMRSVHMLSSGIRLIKNKDIRKLFNQIRG